MSDLKIAISACLLGEQVRYDGGHKLCQVIAEKGIPHLSLQSICPEVAIGMGVPRPTLSLTTKRDGKVALVTNDSGKDLTSNMISWASDAIVRLHQDGCNGLILKSRSPSCGIGDVSIEGSNHKLLAKGSGLFTAAVQNKLPGLPLINEVDLESTIPRDCFFAAASAYGRARSFFGQHSNIVNLKAFHREHESYIQNLHDHERATLARLLDVASESAENEVLEQYGDLFLARVDFGNQASGLWGCLQGFFEARISSPFKEEAEDFFLEPGRTNDSSLNTQLQIGQIVAKERQHSGESLWIHLPTNEEITLRRYFLD